MQGTMRRDEALAFFRMGQHLERAEITCRVLTVRADSAVPEPSHDCYTEVHQMALLRSLASYQPFRRAMPARPDATATLRFLLQDEAFPRAVSACLSELRDLVKSLPHNEPILAACTDTAVLVADAPVAQPTSRGLRAFLAELQPAIGNLHDHIEASFFAPVAAPVGASPRHRAGDDTAVQPLGTGGSPGIGAHPGTIANVSGDRAYRVTHTTTYEYDAPVEQSYNEAHLRPRTTDHQVCGSHSLDVDPPPSTWFESVDPFGNSVATFVVQGGFQRMVVTATSEVVVTPTAPPPAGPPWESVRAMLEIDRQPMARDARRCRVRRGIVPPRAPTGRGGHGPDASHLH
jgi:hypothetical protein